MTVFCHLQSLPRPQKIGTFGKALAYLGHDAEDSKTQEIGAEVGSMPSQPDIRAARVSITESSLIVDLQDGRTLTTPLNWFPDLQQATAEQRGDHRLIGDGIGIHWGTLGIDFSIQGLLFDSPPAAKQQDEVPTRPKRVSYHIVPSNSDWHLKRQGEAKFSAFENKEEAIQAGVKEARSHEAGQLIIHTRDGRFEEERTYGYDPPRTKG